MISRLVVLSTACVLLLAGCGTDEAADPAPAPSSASASASGSASGSPSASASDAGTISYVALGDSFTAAPLVPTTDAANPCLRSDSNYPALVARALPQLALDDVSCSGADSAAMIGAQTIGSQLALPQFDALKPDTDLVTIGLGGNDFGLFTTLLADCASSSDLDGKPCTEAAAADSKKDLTAVLPDVQNRITAVLTGVKAKSPDARILLVGYPRFLPDSGTCPDLPVARGDYDYVRSLISGLDTALRKAAAATGAEYVDVYAASEGHDICSDDPWVNGAVTDPSAALAFHPFASEQKAVADLVVAKLDQ